MTGLIRLSDDRKRIEYIKHRITRDFTKPEASVEAKAYLSLVLLYDYPDERIRLFAPVTIGSSQRTPARWAGGSPWARRPRR